GGAEAARDIPLFRVTGCQTNTWRALDALSHPDGAAAPLAAGCCRRLGVRIIAAVLPGTSAPIEVRELDLAAPRAGEVLVRLHASGVCHSDLNAIDGTSATRCPAVLGHEGAGVVEAVGAGVEIKPGTHVALSWMPSCGRCEECGRGYTHLCRNAWGGMSHGGLLDGTPRLAWDGRPVYHYSYLSTFAEAAVVPEQCVIPIPDTVPFEVAALVGCAVSTGVGAVWNTAGVRPGERVAVIGCGGVGLSAVLGALAIGARRGIGIARGDAMLTLPAIEIPRSERRILGSAYGSARPERDFPRILQLYAEGRLPLDRLISHRMPLAETAAAIDLVRMGTAVRAVLQLA